MKQAVTTILVSIVILIAPHTRTALAAGAGENAIEITLHPQATAEPDLKYRLIPARSDLGPGNAAQVYLLAFGQPVEGLGSDSFQDMLRSDTEGFSLKKAKQFVGQKDAEKVIDYLESAARRETCVWDLPDREQGIESRNFSDLNRGAQLYGGLLFVRARVAITDGQFDLAMRTLQTGFMMGRNLGEGAPLAQVLDGMYVDSLMLADLQQLIQKPGAPNLYWPLVNLPRQSTQIRSTMEADGAMLYRAFPGLRHPERLSADEAREILERLRSLNGHRGSGDIELIAEMMRSYPAAKRHLVELNVLTPGEAESLPANAVVLAWYHEQYRRTLDRFDKLLGLGPWEAYLGSREVIRGYLQDDDSFNPILATMPQYPETILQFALIDRQVAAMTILEAIRAFAAGHGGGLPPSLVALSPLTPAPTDPLTGKSFAYQVEGNSAMLGTPPVGAGEPAPGHTWHIQIAR